MHLRHAQHRKAPELTIPTNVAAAKSTFTSLAALGSVFVSVCEALEHPFDLAARAEILAEIKDVTWTGSAASASESCTLGPVLAMPTPAVEHDHRRDPDRSGEISRNDVARIVHSKINSRQSNREHQ